jgi:pantoate--beta-alanine ligase
VDHPEVPAGGRRHRGAGDEDLGGDGLALSSRNQLLSTEEREQALGLPRALASAAGEGDPVAAARSSLNGLEPEYVEVLDLGDARVLAAAIRVGSTRLIDNVLLEGELR